MSSAVPDADLRIKLPVFEGPLDLLLFLIRKNELDIYDIPIATVTRQYIAVLRSMQELDLDIAGEFFVMAASLMEIKSRMLLPRGQAATGETTDDDPLDPRWELVHQLLQYKKFKEAAAKLDELAAFQRDMLARHVSVLAVTENERPLKPVDRIELWNVFNIVLRRLSEKLVVGEIKGEEVTVSDKMEELLVIVQTKKTFLFTDLFEGRPVTVRVLVATFIAVLELTRLRKLRVRQDEAYTDIYVEAVDENDPGPIPLPPDPAPETVVAAVAAVAAVIEEPDPEIGESVADTEWPENETTFATVPLVSATPPESDTTHVEITAAEPGPHPTGDFPSDVSAVGGTEVAPHAIAPSESVVEEPIAENFSGTAPASRHETVSESVNELVIEPAASAPESVSTEIVETIFLIIWVTDRF